MKGAIFFASKYGSTAQYARWIGEDTGLPVFDTKGEGPTPSEFDFVVIASAVLYFKLVIRKWMRRNLAAIGDRPVVLVTVSGAPAGPRLDGWIANSLPASIVGRMTHFALRGRQDRSRLSAFDKVMLRIGAMMNSDPQARKEEQQGFDFVERAAIGPAVAKIRELQQFPTGA